jgi:hypothetical protein
MNSKIFLLQAQVIANIPFDTIIEYLKRRSNRGSRFRINSINKAQARLLYAYREGFYERMGHWRGPANEIVITDELADKNKVKIDFRYPTSILVAYGLIAVFIVAAGYFLIPRLGVKGSLLIVLALYVGVIVRLNSQFYFFKADLEQLENNYQKGIK